MICSLDWEAAPPQLAAFGILTNTGTVAADGTLAKLIVDTTGFTGGTWSLNLRSPAGDTTLLNAAGAPINLLIEPGLITVIPEPANIVLAITALILVGRWRRKSFLGGVWYIPHGHCRGEVVTDPPVVSPGDVEEAKAPFRYTHSASFAALLQELDASLLVSTYQAGKLVDLERPENGFRPCCVASSK